MCKYFLDCVEFYLSSSLTKFLILGRALCTKNQSHEYYLDGAGGFSAVAICAHRVSIRISFFLPCLMRNLETCIKSHDNSEVEIVDR